MHVGWKHAPIKRSIRQTRALLEKRLSDKIRSKTPPHRAAQRGSLMAGDNRLPIHFFTLVLNGEPFIRYHLERMKRSLAPGIGTSWRGWRTSQHDTAWSLSSASLPTDVVREGRSVDKQYTWMGACGKIRAGLLFIEAPGRLHVGWKNWRCSGARHWSTCTKNGLLWEIDSDELWTTEQFAGDCAKVRFAVSDTARPRSSIAGICGAGLGDQSQASVSGDLAAAGVALSTGRRIWGRT